MNLGAYRSTQGLADHIGGKGSPVRGIDHLCPFIQEQGPALSDLPDIFGKDGKSRTQAQGKEIHCQVSYKGFARLQQDADGPPGMARGGKDFTRDSIVDKRECTVFQDDIDLRGRDIHPRQIHRHGAHEKPAPSRQAPRQGFPMTIPSP
jgi:hypothetical protein